MKHSGFRRGKQSRQIDPGFADALCGSEPDSQSNAWQAERKARQLCRQVQRALNLALAGEALFVDEVTPAPDCGRLLVHVALPPGRAVAEVMAQLREAAPQLRSEVAMAIARKRAPQLFFAPVAMEGGADE